MHGWQIFIMPTTRRCCRLWLRWPRPRGLKIQLVSICGELAGDPMAAVLLMAMGYDVLSMNCHQLCRG